MRRRDFLRWAPAAALAIALPARAQTPLPQARDLRADGQLSRARREPIIVLFSLPGCPYCEIVRRSYLAPMLRDPQQGPRLIVRQIDIDGDQPITGFDGRPVTPQAIARARSVSVAPVVAFWDGAGRDLADPLRGMPLADFYGAYLDDAIAAARAKLAGRP